MSEASQLSGQGCFGFDSSEFEVEGRGGNSVSAPNLGRAAIARNEAGDAFLKTPVPWTSNPGDVLHRCLRALPT